MDCPSCGVGVVKREVTSTNTANRTEDRLVGGRNNEVTRYCDKCGWTSDGTDTDTGRTERVE